jgi:hypothetical protein
VLTPRRLRLVRSALDDNVLSGALPDFWAQLPRLTALQLQFNFFSGARKTRGAACCAPSPAAR